MTILTTTVRPIREIKLAEVLSSLSYALDLVEGQPAGHCVRCCWIGIHIGRELGLEDEQVWELYYTLLLKDLGCSSNAARICQLYLADDLSFKRDFKTVDGSSLTEALQFVLSHTGMEAGLAERFRALVHVVRKSGQLSGELMETRCQRGAEIARKMRFSEAVAAGIQNLDEHWNGSGLPSQLAGESIPLYSRIALLAQVVDVFQTSAGGAVSAVKEIELRAGTWFDPSIVAAFRRVSANPTFWTMLRSDGLNRAVFDLEPAHERMFVDDALLDDIADAFSQVIDAKSPFTSGHSKRVTLFSDMIAEQLHFNDEQRRWLKRAALLHDIGKLGVSNSILDKPGKLDGDEWAAMKAHAALTETILARITAFADLAPIAAAHHEKLDGSGYPRGLKGDEIAFESRILAVADIFDALMADRPYRKAMPVEAAFAILDEMSETKIDAVCLMALKSAMEAAELANTVEDGRRQRS